MNGPPSSLTDTDNPLLDRVPARIDLGTVDIADGNGKVTYGIVTFRTPSTTLTLLLGTEDLENWGKMITDLAGKIRSDAGTAPGLVVPSISETAVFGKGNGTH